jgi:hypothetical protein
MTRSEFEILQDLWNGCIDFETAFLMAGIPDEYKETAKLSWEAWETSFYD